MGRCESKWEGGRQSGKVGGKDWKLEAMQVGVVGSEGRKDSEKEGLN